MLKLNASYSQKVPADGEYTSQSYHASIEVELPDKMLEYLHKQEKITVPKQKNTCISQLGVSVVMMILCPVCISSTHFLFQILDLQTSYTAILLRSKVYPLLIRTHSNRRQLSHRQKVSSS